MHEPSHESFMRDVATHEMTVFRDDGLYRHLRFRRPNTMCMHFDLITYPGYLCYSGDMGTYVFSRLEDMFEFFRTDRDINPGYWSEKLQAVDNHGHGKGSATEFDKSRFERVVKEYLVSWMREGGLNRADRKALREAVQDEVLSHSDDGEHEALSAAYRFEFPTHSRQSFDFNDIWEHRVDRYTHRFIWCCRALKWGIAKYDAERAAVLDQWLLQDSRSYVGNDVLFWAKGGGYTTDVSKAQTFSREEAFRLSAMRDTDRPWPKAYIDGKTRPAVDMQYIKHREAMQPYAVEETSNG